MTRSLLLSTLLAAAIAAPSAAQGPPSTDIWLAPLHVESSGTVTIGEPKNITARPGYDNQPQFDQAGTSLYFTSVREDAQADIWRYDIATGAITRLTTTPESEYSATPRLHDPQARFSVVRVEADSTQRLWSFDRNGQNPELLLPGIKPVGYHAWFDTTRVVVFVLGQPATLRVADIRTGTSVSLATNVGRSLVRADGQGGVSFVQRVDSAWWLSRLDTTASGNWVTMRLVRMPEGADYVAWLLDGRALTVSGTRVLMWDARGSEWTEVADLARYGLHHMSRLAVDPGRTRIAIVAEP